MGQGLLKFLPEALNFTLTIPRSDLLLLFDKAKLKLVKVTQLIQGQQPQRDRSGSGSEPCD